MTSEEISLKLEERTSVRKGLNKLRADGWVPAVIHNHGQDSILVMGQYLPVSKVYAQTGKHHPVYLQVGGKKHLALIKQVDLEPTKRRLRHLVFQAIKQNEAVEAEIPLVLEGEIPAEKVSLMVITNLDVVNVQALPKDLPDKLVVDASGLAEVGDKLTVADIQVPAGVTIMADPETLVCAIEMPKDQIAEADAAAAALASDAGTPEETEATEAAETPEASEAESAESANQADQDNG